MRGLGFGLDFRGADHTTNGIEAGHRRLAVRRRRRLRRRQGGRQRRPGDPDARRRQRPRASGRHGARDLLARHAQRLRRRDRSVHEPVRARQHERRRRLRHPAVSLRRRARVTAIRRCSGTSPTKSFRRSPTTARAPARACCTCTIPACRRRTAMRCTRSTGAGMRSIAIRCTPKGATFAVGQEPFLTRAAAERHGGRRPLAAVRRELARRTVPLRRARTIGYLARADARAGATPPPAPNRDDRHRCAAGRSRRVGQSDAPALRAAGASAPRADRPSASSCSNRASPRPSAPVAGRDRGDVSR